MPRAVSSDSKKSKAAEFAPYEPPYPLLPVRHVRFLAALLQGQSVTEAAQCAQLSRGFASALLNHDPVFIEVLRNEISAVMRATRAAIVHEAAASLRVIREIRDRPDARDGDRLRAAGLILNHMFAVAQTFSELPPNEYQAQGAFNTLRALPDSEDRATELAARLAAFDASPEGKRLAELEAIKDQFDLMEDDMPQDENDEAATKADRKQAQQQKEDRRRMHAAVMQYELLCLKRDLIAKFFPTFVPLSEPDVGSTKHESDGI